MREPCNLDRFVVAQEPVFTTALNELGSGRKRTHWMWFIFPQLRGLGHSSTAEFYGIGSLTEARAYLAHPLLGPRLILCTEAVLGISDRSLQAIFGSSDDMKFRSSMTCSRSPRATRTALCPGQRDELLHVTSNRVEASAGPLLLGLLNSLWP